MMPSDKGDEGSPPAKFESALERDFFVLLEFNVDVLRWDAQPVRLDLGDKVYTPDVLVTYLGPSRRADDVHHVLYEVKYREELQRLWPTLRPKYRAAVRFARSQGWRFKLITEREIRTELLWNAKFLLPYRHDPPVDEDCDRLLRALANCEVTTPSALLTACSMDPLVQARLLTSLWHLVARRVVAADLTCRLRMDSAIWRDGQ